jgi:hypothetical protein
MLPPFGCDPGTLEVMNGVTKGDDAVTKSRRCGF